MALRMKHHLGASLTELRHEPVPVRLRAFDAGEAVLDTLEARLVWEPRRLVPVYAVPVADVRVEVTAGAPVSTDLTGVPPMLGPEHFLPHTTPGRVASVGGREDAGFLPDDPDLAGLVVLDFTTFEEWRAEDEPLVAHARDPFKRIDVLAGSRPVEVLLDGQVLAVSTHPVLLVETHLPVRYYLPRADVRTDLLVPSATRSQCAYKGEASYLSTADGSAAGRDIAWTYPDPLGDALRVRDHVCFWAERTDLVLDGRPVPRPVTPWSTPEEQAGADPDRLEFG